MGEKLGEANRVYMSVVLTFESTMELSLNLNCSEQQLAVKSDGGHRCLLPETLQIQETATGYLLLDDRSWISAPGQDVFPYIQVVFCIPTHHEHALGRCGLDLYT